MGHLKRQRESRSEEIACASAAKKERKKNRQSNVNHVLMMPFFVFERTMFKLHTGLPLCDFRDPGWVEFIVG